MNKIIKIFLTILFLFFSYSKSFSQPQTEWIRQFNSGGSNQDYVNDMKLDKLGNIYLCGYVRYDAQNSDVLLLKYNSSGALQWSRTYNGRTTFSNDVAKKIIIDDSGYVYLMGKVQFNTITDFLIMKYTPNGDTVWVRSFDGGNGEADEPTDFALDNNYNLYVTGLIYRKGNNDIGTIKYDNNGNLKWERINFYGAPGSILIDSGNVYINCGLYQDTTNQKNISILKYDTSGKSLDTINYRVSVNIGVKQMIFDSNKNFIVSGVFDAGNPTQIDILSAKISQDGTGNWSNIFNNNFDNASESIRDLKVDIYNNIYLLARDRNVQYQRAEIALIKYNNLNGDSLWMRKYSSVPFSTDEPSKMSLDKNGNIYIIGSSDFNLLNNRFVLTKYNPQGALIWHTEYTPSVFVNSEGLRIQNDTLGNLYVSGITNSSSNGDDIVLIKYSHITDIKETDNIVPEKYELYQNHPNPFNPFTSIQYDLPSDNFVSIKIFDIMGREITTLVNEFKTAGRYSIGFNGANLSSGIYYYKIEAGNFTQVRKMILLK